MSDNLKAQLHDAFKRKRYGGDGEYDPDFDLFDVAAAEIERLEAALREAEEEVAEGRRVIDGNTQWLAEYSAEVERQQVALRFDELRVANAARQAEWDPSDSITLAYRGNELGGEAGEAQNVIKKIERERLGIRGSRATLDDLASELADVVICVDLIAMGEGINLGKAVVDKFNATSEKYKLATHLVALSGKGES